MPYVSHHNSNHSLVENNQLNVRMEPGELKKFLNDTNNFVDETSFILKLSPTWAWITWIWITASLVIGWIAKYYIYQHIFRTKIKDQVSSDPSSRSEYLRVGN